MGHVHLKVADLERALGFYQGVLGFELTQRMGDSAAFLSAGGYHHHIGLNTWESEGGIGSSRQGLRGCTIWRLFIQRGQSWRDALRRLIDARIPLDGAADHGVSEALYLRDPDGNGVELYWDRPQEDWPRDARVDWRCTRGRWICNDCWMRRIRAGLTRWVPMSSWRADDRGRSSIAP